MPSILSSFLLHLSDALPSGRVLLRLSISVLTLTVLLRCRLFKWTLTTASTLPRGTVVSLSGYFRFRSVCLYVTGFTRCWVNSYFWKNQFADLFVTGRPVICIPSSWSIFAPILYIFCWALISRSCQVPHFGHIHFLTLKSLTSVFLYPQQPQVCDDGYHLLIFLKYLPARSIYFILYHC